MGLVDREGSKEWKDIVEKWLFPDLKSSDIPVPEAHYAIGTCNVSTSWFHLFLTTHCSQRLTSNLTVSSGSSRTMSLLAARPAKLQSP